MSKNRERGSRLLGFLIGLLGVLVVLTALADGAIFYLLSLA